MATRNFLYAAVGVGDLALEKARGLDPAKVRKNLPKRLAKIQGTVESAGTKLFSDGISFYRGLVKRGETSIRSVRNSSPVKRAVAQSKTARTQTKAAATSTRKAAETTVEAVKEAASNL
jgi:hypothetical protein